MLKAGFLTKLLEYFSRKFVLSAGGLIGSFVLVWNGKDIDQLTDAILVILGSYGGANVLEKYVDKRNERKDKEPSNKEPEELGGSSD